MVTSTHRIRKQQWLVSTTTANDAFTLRKQIRERLEDTLEPVFNRAFDEVSDNDQIIRLPKLEIKLKVKNDAELWENLPQALYEQLKIHLQNISNKDIDSPIAITENSIVPDQLHRFDILIHYLYKGFLPWYVHQLSALDSVEELKVTIQDQFDQLIEYLNNNKSEEAVFFRLFQLVPTNLIIGFIERLFKNSPLYGSEDLIILFARLFESTGSAIGQHSRLSIAATLASLSCNFSGHPDFAKLISEATNSLPEEKANDFHKLISSLPEFQKLFPHKEREVFDYLTPPEDKKQLSERINNNEDQPTGQDESDQETFLSEGNHNQQLSEHLRQVSNKTNGNYYDLSDNSLQNPELMSNNLSDLIIATGMVYPISENKLQQTNRLKVQYAGLVILHPFLQRLFAQTGIVNEGEKNIPFQNLSKAAALLHFIATGNDEVFEFELGFIKVLIGLVPEAPLLVSNGLLNSLEKEECISLVLAVIGYWSILKNTSVDGLRQTFLHRNALLNITDMGWTLQVESTPFDLLINHLPWSFSIVKLPWMKKPIYTEWQAT